jgi:hypothetical protein
MRLVNSRHGRRIQPFSFLPPPRHSSLTHWHWSILTNDNHPRKAFLRIKRQKKDMKTMLLLNPGSSVTFVHSFISQVWWSSSLCSRGSKFVSFGTWILKYFCGVRKTSQILKKSWPPHMCLRGAQETNPEVFTVLRKASLWAHCFFYLKCLSLNWLTSF